MERINIDTLPETNVDWYADGERANALVLNRPIKQVAGIVNTLIDTVNDFTDAERVKLANIAKQGAASWSADGAPYPSRAQVYHNSKQWLALRANSVEPAEGADWTELVGKQYVDASSLPAGSLIYYAGSVAPAGYLEANGAWLSRTTYAELFAAIGIISNAGDGSTTFGLPDLRGEFIRGWDNGRGIDAPRLIGSKQEQSVAAHKHVTPWGENSTISAAATARQWGYTRNSGKFGINGAGLDYDNVWHHTNEGWDYDGPVNPAGLISGENRPRNVAALICIKY